MAILLRMAVRSRLRPSWTLRPKTCYMVEVTATDPSEASEARSMVMITVKDLNEKAEIAGDDSCRLP